MWVVHSKLTDLTGAARTHSHSCKHVRCEFAAPGRIGDRSTRPWWGPTTETKGAVAATTKTLAFLQQHGYHIVWNPDNVCNDTGHDHVWCSDVYGCNDHGHHTYDQSGNNAVYADHDCHMRSTGG